MENEPTETRPKTTNPKKKIQIQFCEQSYLREKILVSDCNSLAYCKGKS